jgi:hypothetical protein
MAVFVPFASATIIRINAMRALANVFDAPITLQASVAKFVQMGSTGTQVRMAADASPVTALGGHLIAILAPLDFVGIVRIIQRTDLSIVATFVLLDSSETLRGGIHASHVAAMDIV